MKKLSLLSLLAFLVILLSSTSCIYLNNNGIKGNKQIKKERREIGDFRKIELSGSFKVLLEQGRTSSLTLKTDENLLPYIKTKVEGDKLIIKSTKNLDPSRENIVYLSFIKLEDIDFSGACALIGQNAMTFDHLKLEGSGAGDLDLELQAHTLDFELSGASSVSLEGRADLMILKVSGAGKIRAFKLRVKQADIDLSGAAYAAVYVEERLDAEISGAGKLSYRGNPAHINKEISGAGIIVQE